MRPSSRSVSPSATLAHLEKKHAELDAEVGMLEAKPHLPPEDEMELLRLKKLKLAAKDEMIDARRML